MAHINHRRRYRKPWRYLRRMKAGRLEKPGCGPIARTLREQARRSVDHAEIIEAYHGPAPAA